MMDWKCINKIYITHFPFLVMVQEILGLHGSLSKFINEVVNKLNCLQCISCFAHLVVNLMHPTL